MMRRQVFEGFVTRVEQREPSQDERECLVQMVLLVSYADGSVGSEETELLEELCNDFSWDSEVPLANFIAKARGRALELLKDRDALVDELVTWSRRIRDPSFAREVYLLCDTLANRDGRVSDEERAVLQGVIAAFAPRD